MTDVERNRLEAICKVAKVDDIEDLSDGFHTFRQLYYQRMMLFATIVKQNKDKAWKSLRHEDGELCFGGGWFIVGIDTPDGTYTYHYESNFYSMFDCKELERARHWDGHTEKDVTRLLSLPSAQKWIPCSEETGEGYPKEDGFYYVTEQNYGFYLDAVYKQRVTHTSHFRNGDFTDRFYAENNSNITAWMQLPEPYQEEKQ